MLHNLKIHKRLIEKQNSNNEFQFYKQVKSGKQNKKKKTCYIYCCIINNAPSEQILAGFLICHLQVSDTFSTHTVQNGYNHPKRSPDKSLEQVYKTHRMTYIRKVRPLLEDALLWFSAHLYLHLSLLV